MKETYSEMFKTYIKNDLKEGQVSENRTIYRFPNDYGASVVFGGGSYGLEVAILYFPEEETDWVISETSDTNPKLEYINDLDVILKEIYEM